MYDTTDILSKYSHMHNVDDTYELAFKVGNSFISFSLRSYDNVLTVTTNHGRSEISLNNNEYEELKSIITSYDKSDNNMEFLNQYSDYMDVNYFQEIREQNEDLYNEIVLSINVIKNGEYSYGMSK
jgi:hypothetical protein